jgi:hypothetical protein
MEVAWSYFLALLVILLVGGARWDKKEVNTKHKLKMETLSEAFRGYCGRNSFTVQEYIRARIKQKARKIL